jgi:hypothetical protein
MAIAGLKSESPQERQRALSHGVAVMFSLGTDGKCPQSGAGGTAARLAGTSEDSAADSTATAAPPHVP